MKTLTILLISLLSTAVFGQNKDEMLVIKTVETLKQLMLNPNKEGLTNISHASLSYGHSGGKIENQAQFIEAFVSGASDFVALDFTEIQTTIVGKTATVRHILTADSNDKGKPAAHVNLKVLLVFVKVKSEWKLLARQAVKI